jgi:hypothetical protein
MIPVMAMRFIVSFVVFTLGPGAAATFWLTRQLDPARRFVVMLAAGIPASAVLIDLLGRAGAIPIFPYLAAAFTLLAVWSLLRSRTASTTSDGNWTRRDIAACGVVVGLAIGTGAIAFAHRLDNDPAQLAVYGDYDSLDLAYYGAISAEASHTVPPTAPYYSGRELNYAYYPQLVLAMVHRFAEVPILDIYFRYSWPAFLAIGALAAYLLVRELSSTATALLAVALLLLAGDFSYLAAWYLPHEDPNWDYVLWPTNFLSPTMEVLHFNSWTPSLPIFFTLLWGIVYAFKTGVIGWLVTSGLMLGVLFQFKPFAFIVLSAALGLSILFSGRDWSARIRYGVVLLAGGISALPFVYRSLRLYADRRSELRLDFFVLPERMLIKLDLTELFTQWAERLAPVESMRPLIVLFAATVLFFAGGLGIRWLGLPGVWRGLRGLVPADGAAWRLLAWGVVAGIAIPFVLVTEPYNDTLQFYQVGLYLLWIFTAAALMTLVRRNPSLGMAATVAAFALSLPSSAHYLSRKWSDNQRPPLATLSGAELEIASHLRGLDPAQTVVLNDRPRDPSLLAVVSGRRLVLAWGRYAVGSGERMREVEAFFRGSRTPENTLDILRKHQVSHVVVHGDRNRVRSEVLGKLKPVLGDSEVMLYEVPRE